MTEAEVHAAARRAQEAAAILRTLPSARKDAGLAAIADALMTRQDEILAANNEDVDRARDNGTSVSLIDRLTLTPERITAIANAMRAIIDLQDPVGDVVRGYTLPNGLQVSQVRVPMGVVGMIYEARPNVTVDAAGLTLKSGNACLLRGSSSAADSNQVLVNIMRDALVAADLPADAVVAVPGTSHDSVDHLMQARGLVDVLIPRGGAALINRVVQGSVVPVIETGVGNCHVYVDESADLAMAQDIVMNAKVQRPSVCNAAETLLVDAAVAAEFLPKVGAELIAADVTLHTDNQAAAILAEVGIPSVAATDVDWGTEYIALDLAVAVVDGVDGAISHIRDWTSGHTEAVLADSERVIEKFLSGVDSSAVMINTSTRFTDGEQFGFGAEIGISTQKLHARGPMALPELTTTTYVVRGSGQIRT